MSELRALQATFFEAITADDPPAGQLRVYADAYDLRLVGALAEDFEKVVSVLGADAFRPIARAYLSRHPSTSPTLRDLGRELPRFLDQHASAAQARWLAELARLEWARIDVFDAADGAALDQAALGRIPHDAWPRAAFRLAPWTRVLALEWAVQTAWRDLDAGRPASAPPREPTTLVVWRRADGVVVHRAATSPAEGEALVRLSRGAAFPSVCEAFAAGGAIEEAATRALERLRQWLADGILDRVDWSEATGD